MTTNTPYTLSKNDSVDVTDVLRVGVSWDTSTRGMGGLLGRFSKKVGTDLDLLAIALRADGQPVRMAGLDNLDPFKDGSMVHSGDNQSGHGEGDDETVTVYLDKVPQLIHTIVFVAAAFKHNSSFAAADNLSFHVYDNEQSTAPAMQFWPSLLNAARNNACVIMRAERTGSLWQLKPVDKMAHVKQGDKDSLLTVSMRTQA